MRAEDRNRQAGFSLVELAIVLVIIGLIVGGVLKGQDLIQSARLNDIQTTLNEVRTASSTFQDKYGGFPGDFDQASTYVSGDADDGNGNGRVGAADGSRTGACASVEACGFWQHLEMADLVGGVGDLAGGTYNGDNVSFTASIGGFYTILYGDTAGDATTSDHWIRLGGGTDNSTPVISPVDLRSIDVKADDGEPESGNIRGSNEDTTNATCTQGTDTVLYASNDDEGCTGYFAL